MPIEKVTAEPTVSFEEQMRQAEQAAGVPPDSEYYAEFGVENPEPDERGMTPTNRPVEAEATPEAPEATPEPEAEAAPEEETVEAVPEPDLSEINKKLGQLINENAELRRQLETPEPEPQQYQAPPLNQETLGYFDEVAMDNPQQAVQIAIQAQQPFLYERAMRSWHEQDPVAAGRFERQAEMAQLEQRIQAHMQPQIQSSQNLVQNNELEKAFEAVAGRHEDFAQVIGTLDEERAKQIVEGGLPVEILEGLKGSQDAKERVFETMYRWVKAEQAGIFTAASEQAATQQVEEAKQAKRDAAVASATTTTPDAVPETEEERMQRAFKELRPSMQNAWTGREAAR